MIIGIGTDIVQIPRIEKILAKYGHLFTKRILGDNELNKFRTLSQNKQALYIAKRFAAKESISKAIGSGIATGLAFKDIEILNDSLGKPYTKFAGNKLKNLQIDISLSDDYPTALAFAVISRNP